MSEIALEELPGVGPATAEKLKEAGFNTIEAVAVASPSELATTAEIGESTAAKIINAARQAADIGGFETGDIVLERRKMVGKLTTGCTEFDEMMGDNLPSKKNFWFFSGILGIFTHSLSFPSFFYFSSFVFFFLFFSFSSLFSSHFLLI